VTQFRQAVGRRKTISDGASIIAHCSARTVCPQIAASRHSCSQQPQRRSTHTTTAASPVAPTSSANASSPDQAHLASWRHRLRMPLSLTFPSWPSSLHEPMRHSATRVQRQMEEWTRMMTERLAQANPYDATDVPQLYYHPSEFNRAVVSGAPALTRPFMPTPWMRSAHTQTILGTLLRFRPRIIYEREVMLLRDGGAIALDWDSGVNDAKRVQFRTGKEHPTPENPCLSTQPILVHFPGLTGGSNSKYLCQMVEMTRELGFRSVVFNFRGIMISMRTPMPSTGVNIDDLIHTFEHLHACYPNAPKLAVSFSMGANMLVKTLGTLGDRANKLGLVASACVSCAFDFVELSHSLRKPTNELLYSRFLTMQLKRNYIKMPGVQSVSRHIKKIDMAHALKAKTIWELDDRFTKHMYGIDDTLEYYRRMSSSTWVKHIASPTFLLNALDDPFSATIPYDCVKSNPHIILATTKRGGHVAWASGTNPLRQKSSWMMTTTLAYLKSAFETSQRLARPSQMTETSVTASPGAAETGSSAQ
jgi:predicted alpha/beta-fold hydrolase